MSGEGRWRWVGVAVAVATVVGAALRLIDLGARPIHHDEAVNWFRFAHVARTGVYSYDPANYHGPLHFQVGAAARWLFGTDLAATRLPLALVGSTLPPMAWGLRHRLGALGTVTLAWLLATSPMFVYYSRDAIHELWLVAATLMGVVAAVQWFDTPDGPARDRWAWTIGLSLGVGVAIKETVVISGAGLALGGVLAAFGAGGLPAGAPWKRGVPRLVAGLLVVVLLSYTNGLRDGASLIRLAETLNIWAARGAEGAGHDKPAPYFVELMWRYDPHLVLLGAIGAVAAVWRRDALGLVAVGWAAVQLGVYAAIPYKTPWLVVQMMLPLAVLAAQAAPRSVSRAAVVGWGALLVVVCGLAGQEAVRLSFVDHDTRGEAVVYVQTNRQLVEVMADMIAIAEVVGEDARLQSFFHARYPMNWYLRDQPLKRHKDAAPWPDIVTADAIMLAPNQEHELLPRLDAPHLRRQIRFRNDSRMVVYVPARHRALLSDPEQWEEVRLAPATFTPPEPPTGKTRDGLEEQRFGLRVPAGPPALRATWSGEDEAHERERSKPVRSPVYVLREGWWTVPTTGSWTLSTRSDDGSRLWVDGQLVVDNLGSHTAAEVRGEVTLEAGMHHLRVDWYDLGGKGSLEVRAAVDAGESAPIAASDLSHRRARRGDP